MSFTEQPSTSARDITVPANLPLILKQFCKAAIRTQPHDLLKWSSSYFRALADGEEPPVKSRLEYSSPSTASGLTLGFLKVLLRQFGNYNKTLTLETIAYRWDCLCLDRRDFETILTIGRFRDSCQIKKFLAIAVGLLGANLTETMIMVCQLFTREPDGGSAMIPFTLFIEIYEYLAGLVCDGSERKDSFDEDTTAGKDSPIHHTDSINSQETDMDVLDPELMSKDKIDSFEANPPPAEPIEDISLNKNDIECEEKEDSLIEKDREDNTIDTRSCAAENTSNIEKSVSSESEKVMKTTHYLNVPGIGPRLSAERVASVAAWMMECAKLQAGMVGPRNIRHTDCPSLHQQSTSKSES